MGRRVAVLALLGLAACSTPAPGSPRVSFGLGATAAVPHTGGWAGVSTSVALLWPIEPYLEFGPMLFADDLGTRMGRLVDQHDGTDLGAVALGHRMTYGAAWRVDVPFDRSGLWKSYATTTWAYYRLREDERGRLRDHVSSTGLSAGLGTARPAWKASTLGASIRYHRLFNNRIDQYLGLSIDWGWR